MDLSPFQQFLSLLYLDLVSALDNYVVTQVACGASHSMALNEWGQLFTWGSNTCGQLAKDTNELLNVTPKIVKTLATKSIIQIACGHYHSMALTNSKINVKTVSVLTMFIKKNIFRW